MKYCTHCGAEMINEAVICTNCGCAAADLYKTENSETSSTLKTVAKVFMIIGCVLSGFYFLIPLCWTIPMTVKYCRAVDAHKPVDTGFKVCTLIFVSLVAGIIMLCDNEQ